MPQTHAEVEALPGFDVFRPLFREQERAADEETGSGSTPAPLRSAEPSR
jgi:hypothetical protein